jgi:hypothetical protein
MNQLFGCDSKSEEEINTEIKKCSKTKNTRESVWKQFHKFIQGCIHLLKIFAGITSGISPIRFPRVEYSDEFFETMVTNV